MSDINAKEAVGGQFAYKLFGEKHRAHKLLVMVATENTKTLEVIL